MESQINEVKSRTDIVGLISNYVSLKKAGRNYKGVCPFHSEKTPSFMVSPERQIFKCFGCSEGGDVLTFYQKIEGVEFGEALKGLASKAGVILKEYRPSPAETQKEVFSQINSKISEFYHFLLTQHPVGKKALDYLKERGLNEKSIKDFQLGFAPDSWDSAFKFLTKKKFSNKDIIAAGIALPSNRSGAYDRFRKRIIFPIRNISGNVVGFSARIFGDPPAGGEPKYLNSPDNLLFNKSNILFGLDLAKSEIKKADNTILVEGNLDVIASVQVGVKNIVCPLGTALTERQLELIRRFSENLTISFDTDSAGFTAAVRAIDLAERQGLNTKLIELNAKDPDELIKKNPNLWKEALKRSVAGYEFIFNKTIEFYGGDDPAAIRKITAQLVPLLQKISNEITRSYYERLLAAKLGVDIQSVRSEVQKGQNYEKTEISQESPKKVGNERLFLEKYLLTLITQAEILPKEIVAEDFEDSKLRTIFALLVKNSPKGKISLEKVAKVVPDELEEIFNEISLKNTTEIVLDQEEIIAEINTCALRLKELNLRTRLKEASLAIKQAELRKENQKIASLTKQFDTLSNQLSKIEKIKDN